MTWRLVRFRVEAGRAKGDPEKLVTPGIIYCAKSDPRFTAGLIAIGWWDWHLSVLWAGQTRAQAMSAREGQDPQGLGAQPASEVGNADAPTPPPEPIPHV